MVTAPRPFLAGIAVAIDIRTVMPLPASADVEPIPASGINSGERVVGSVCVEVPGLRIRRALACKWDVCRCEPSLRPGEIARAEVIQVRFRVPFFAGET